MNSKTLMEINDGNLMGHKLTTRRDENQEPLFIGKDITDIIGIKNHRDALSRLDEDEKVVGIADSLGGPQKVVFVNESGLYHLIFMSRKPEAKAFRKWVTSEVLPSIRKTGLYSGDAASLAGARMRSADYVALRGIEGSVSGFGSSVVAICRKVGLEFERKPKRGHKFPVAALDMAVGGRKALRGPLAKADNERVFFFQAD